jgi:hypothetical protein
MAGLVDAAAVAAHLGVSRDYVYEHASELGALIDPIWESRSGHAVAAARYAVLSRPMPSEKSEDENTDPRAALRARLGVSWFQGGLPAVPNHSPRGSTLPAARLFLSGTSVFAPFVRC